MQILKVILINSQSVCDKFSKTFLDSLIFTILYYILYIAAHPCLQSYCFSMRCASGCCLSCEKSKAKYAKLCNENAPNCVIELDERLEYVWFPL